MAGLILSILVSPLSRCSESELLFVSLMRNRIKVGPAYGSGCMAVTFAVFDDGSDGVVLCVLRAFTRRMPMPSGLRNLPFLFSTELLPATDEEFLRQNVASPIPLRACHCPTALDIFISIYNNRILTISDFGILGKFNYTTL